MKAIFLDVDGVLNCQSSQSRCRNALGIDDDKVERVKQIVEKTGARIVLSSSWKDGWEPICKDDQTEDSNYLDRKLRRQGLVAIDKTYEPSYERRGEGIIKWIIAHDVDSFIILDDEWFDYKKLGLASKVIKTEFYSPVGGLTDTDVELAIKLLNSEQAN